MCVYVIIYIYIYIYTHIHTHIVFIGGRARPETQRRIKGSLVWHSFKKEREVRTATTKARKSEKYEFQQCIEKLLAVYLERT